MHRNVNVNEWCVDFYVLYNVNDKIDPVGSTSGTRHVYRGDFAKNMKSAYRAADEDDFKSYNLGVRLVRNATDLSNCEIVKFSID